MKSLTYAIIFIVIGMCGSFLADIMKRTGCPQHICNVIYCSIITLFAMENWSLLSDLNKLEERYAAKNLARRCSILQKQNNALRNTPETSSEVPRNEPTNREDITTAMNTWIIYCNTENTPPPSMVFLVNPSESHNTQKLSPLSVKFQNATPKVPPITRGESL